MSDIFNVADFNTEDGRRKMTLFLNNLDQWQRGVNEQLYHLVTANQQKLIDMGFAYAKPENLGTRMGLSKEPKDSNR
jgi:hypothetical protein